MRTRTGLVYDARMLTHRNIADEEHPECPERISFTYDMLRESGLVGRCVPLPIPERSPLEDLKLVHSIPHIRAMAKTRGTSFFQRC